MGSIAILAALASATVVLRADPPVVVLGTDSASTIEVLIPELRDQHGEAARVSLSATVGQVGPAEAVGPGAYRARYLPPDAPFPQVAILRAEVELAGGSRFGWLALPLHGSALLEVKTRRGAQVEFTVAGRTEGPFVADRQGLVQASVSVPPGVRSVSARALGGARLSQRVIDLDLPPFPRAAIGVAGPPEAVAGSDAVRIEVFAIEPDGSPAAAPPAISADRGTLQTAAPGRPGVFTFDYRPPEQVGQGAVRLRAAMEGEAAGAVMELRLRPGAPARLELRLSPTEVVAGATVPVEVTALAFDARGNTVPVEPRDIAADLGAIEPSAGGATAALRVPASFGGRTRATVRATAGGLTAEQQLLLQPGPPVAGEIVPERGEVRAGKSIRARLSLRDAFGNPVTGAALAARASTGRLEAAGGPGDGCCPLSYAAPLDAGGTARLEVQPRGSDLLVARDITVLPVRRPWAVWAGAALRGHTNFERATGGGPALEVDLSLGRSPFDALLRAEGTFYNRAQRAIGGGAAKVSTTQALGLELGLRYEKPLSAEVAAAVSLAAGIRRTQTRIRIEGGPADGQSDEAGQWDPVGTAAAGASYRLGPGRLTAELQAIAAPVRAPLEGNLGGFALSAGYQLALY